MMKPLPFETLHDAEGSVTVGWAGDSVLYAFMEGSLSAQLGSRFATELQSLVAGLSGIHYFGDASNLTRYDLIARSAFVRVALAQRKCFASFTLLVWPQALSRGAHALSSALGESLTLCHAPADFERRLLDLAPLARYRIDPGNTERFESSERMTR